MSVVTKIVTHPGQAHRDEFMAICLWMAANRQLVIQGSFTIERRNPTPEEMEDPAVLVLDQGGRYEPELNNFDHHQFGRDADAACSITLILFTIGVELEKARKVWPWLEFSEWLDSKGPYQTAAKFGMDPNTLINSVSPVEAFVLRMFQAKNLLRPVYITGESDPVLDLMMEIGQEKLDYYREVDERLDLLQKEVVFTPLKGYDNAKVADVTAIPRDVQPVLALEIFLDGIDSDCPVTVTQDDRGEGVCLFRRNNDLRIDFSRVEKMEGVLFAHKNGFVAKLHKDVPWQPILEAATLVAVPV